MRKASLFFIFFIINIQSAFSLPALKVIGLMSGTSMDGIDVCLIETDGQDIFSIGKGHTYTFTEDFRRKLRQRVLSKDKQNDGLDIQLERQLTVLHAQAVKDYITQHHLCDVDLIGFHGQTIDHRPDEHHTYQIGDGQLLADLTGIEVINDFRSNDVANGGQGAPLAPIYHQTLAKGLEAPVVFVNIGGVSNITYIDKDGLIAFDTGPGNALLDDWIFAHTGKSFDEDGNISAKGTVAQAIVDGFLNDSYFLKRPPKSLDRNDFKDVMNKTIRLSLEDGAATLLNLTSSSIAASEKILPKKVKHWYICGGGRHNKTLMKSLQQTLNGEVKPVEAIGHDGDFLEAQLIGFLAVRSKYNLPFSFPQTTGVTSAFSGGKSYSPALSPENSGFKPAAIR